jgi:hypothetical protein
MFNSFIVCLLFQIGKCLSLFRETNVEAIAAYERNAFVGSMLSHCRTIFLELKKMPNANALEMVMECPALSQNMKSIAKGLWTVEEKEDTEEKVEVMLSCLPALCACLLACRD